MKNTAKDTVEDTAEDTAETTVMAVSVVSLACAVSALLNYAFKRTLCRPRNAGKSLRESD